MAILGLVKAIGVAAGAILLSATAAMAIEAAATGTANVRTGPGTSYAVVDTLSPGEVVDVVECTAAGTWCRIFHEGPDGWVARSLLGAPGSAGTPGSNVQFGMTIPLPGGGSITFGTPGYKPPPGPLPPPPPPYKRVCVYDYANYTGASVCVNAPSASGSLGPAWNNRVTSLRVFGGAKIRLCQDPGFGGFCNVFATNVPKLGVPLNNRASSYQVW